MTLKRAAIINGISRFSKIFIQLVVNAVLARLLTPAEYGIITIITVFSTFFNTFVDMGFGAAVIQHKDLSDEDINHIYSLTVYLGLVLAIVFCVASIPISSFYGNGVYMKLGPLLALSLFFNAINMVPNSILMRDKKFMAVAIRTVVVYLGGGLVAIFLALFHFSYYSLVLQTVLIAFASYIWNYFSTRPKLWFKISKSSISKVASFSFYQFAFNVVNYFSRNLDNLLTGKFLGDVQLAYYDKAYTLMLYPVNNLTGVISPVLHPMLSDYQDNHKYIYDAYIKISRILGILGIYASAFCFLASKELTLIIYGPQWEFSIQCFKVLSVIVVTQMLNSTSGAIFQSLGNTKLLFTSGIINTVITIIMILIGLVGGGSIYTLAFCIVIAYVLHYVLAQLIIMKYGFGYNVLLYVKDMRKEILIFVVTITSAIIYPFSIGSLFLSFCTKLIWISAIMVVMLILTNEHKVLIDMMKRGKDKK